MIIRLIRINGSEFCVINNGINLISTIITFIQWMGKVAEHNARLDRYAENTYLTEAVERSRRQISSIWILARLCTKKSKARDEQALLFAHKIYYFTK